MKKVMVCSKLRGYVMFAFSLVNTCKRFLRHGLPESVDLLIKCSDRGGKVDDLVVV